MNAAEQNNKAAQASIEVAKQSLEVSQATLEAAKQSAQQSLDVARAAIESSKAISDRQILLSQRQSFFEIWDHLLGLSVLGPTPTWQEVRKTANTLELVAIACESGMVDKAVVLRTFRDHYLQLGRALKQAPYNQDLGKTGSQVLDENRAAKVMLEELDNEDRNRDKTKPV